MLYRIAWLNHCFCDPLWSTKIVLQRCCRAQERSQNQRPLSTGEIWAETLVCQVNHSTRIVKVVPLRRSWQFNPIESFNRHISTTPNRKAKNRGTPTNSNKWLVEGISEKVASTLWTSKNKPTEISISVCEAYIQRYRVIPSSGSQCELRIGSYPPTSRITVKPTSLRFSTCIEMSCKDLRSCSWSHKAENARFSPILCWLHCELFLPIVLKWSA